MSQQNITPLFRKMLTQSDSFLNWDPQKDYVKHHHIDNLTLGRGNGLKILSTADNHHECVVTFTLTKDGEKEPLVQEFKYITNRKQTLETTLKEISGIVQGHHKDKNIQLIHHVSVIRPLKSIDYIKRIKKGELIDGSFHISFPETARTWSYRIHDWIA